MKKQSFAKGAILLAVCSIAAKLLGAVYRIALTSALGAEGIGYYQLVFPFFALALAVSSNAIPVTLSRQISAELSAGREGAVKSIVRSALKYAFIAGSAGVILTVVLSRLMAGAQSQAGVYICYIAIAPAIIFVAVANVFKGWFLGHSNTAPAGISQIIEVIVKLATGLLIVKAMSARGVIYAVAGGLTAVSISEFVSLAAVYIWYLSAGRSERFVPLIKSEQKFINSLAPITLSGLIFPLIAFIDSIMVVNLLAAGGRSDAVSQYGILTGPVASLINMPIVLAMSVSAAIVPAVASAMSGYDVVSIKHKTAGTIKMCLAVAMPFFIGATVMSKAIVGALYPTLSDAHKDLTAALMSLMAVNIVVLSLLEVLDAILQGLGRLKQVLVNIAVGGAVKIIAELIFVPVFGIAASGISTIAFYLIALALNGAYYNKLVGKNAKLFKSISKIVLAGAIMSLAVLPGAFINNEAYALLYAIGAGGTAYVAMLLILRIFDEKEIMTLPMGGAFSRLLVKAGYFKENGNYDNGGGVGMR